MSLTTPLGSARGAVADRRWADALEALSSADAAETVAASDLDVLATVAFLRGELEASATARERAYQSHLAANETAGAVLSASLMTLELIERGDYSRCVAWGARAAQLLLDVPSPGAIEGYARLGAAIGQMGIGQPRQARAQFADIVALADREGDRQLTAVAGLGLGNAWLAEGALSEGLAALDAALDALDEHTMSPEMSGIVLSTVAYTALVGFDVVRALRWTERLERWCAAQPQLIVFSAHRHAVHAALQLLHGNWTAASASADLAMVGLRAGDYRAAWSAPYQLGELHRLRGSFHSAEQSYARSAESGWEAQPGLALLHLATGRISSAQELIRRAVAASDAVTRLHLLPASIEIEVAAADVAAAQQSLEALTAGARSAPTPYLDAVVMGSDGRVQLAEGYPARARDRAREAVRAFADLGMPYERATSRALLGRALVLLDDPSGRAELTAARDAFTALGATPAASEIDALSGGTRTTALTSRELDVLRLVSTGLTNRSVASRLSLSEKTIARHLSNIYGKLGISSRAAATAYAYESGIV